ncbi:glycosyltransferase involved in cell wall biosynthesis [Microbacteriaceae bacterium SG_E_30_P1]|uniref:Glycosyltransferase involved in cell wall biosynthesis n=1 Tax=Antiquaquibacter oligotrophicus TaxID=2880260 RepID=A0ABT6KPF8_9MICO|nr:glycosyltransferase family 2 protein [Antiquaquibacter oligotrophicus]MDH6181876.1 glycosyltransferase involved in cell wall biosynthesis [Antiquaquibacter oligotrophicus]UDF12449.1 glycosyltransferase [Antiquaquibacter oligotrophicus]
MTKHHVSVVMPLHNARAHLQSARDQLELLDRAVAYEIVVIDDHSTDSTAEEVLEWVPPPGSSLKVLQSSGRGVAAARNEALASCSGEFVWFVDADDVWAPTIVSEMVMAIGDADVVLCNADKRSRGGDLRGTITDAEDSSVISGDEAFRRLLGGFVQGHLWNKLFRRSVIPADPFPRTRAHSDLGGVMRIFSSSDRVALLPRSLYQYMLSTGSILNSSSYNWDDLSRCLDIAAGLVEQRPEIDLARSLCAFKYRSVVVPIAIELARRRDLLASNELKRLRRLNRSRISASDLMSGVIDVQTAAAVIAVWISPALFEYVYRSRRSGTWISISRDTA